jgi:hypothetical protein
MSFPPNPGSNDNPDDQSAAGGATPPPEPGLGPPAPVPPSAPPPVPSAPPSASDEHLRKEAQKRVKAKQNVNRMAGGFVIVWAILIGIWWLSGRGYFWPAWAIFGMSIALAFSAWGAYGPKEGVSEADIDREMRKMQGG